MENIFKDQIMGVSLLDLYNYFEMKLFIPHLHDRWWLQDRNKPEKLEPYYAKYIGYDNIAHNSVVNFVNIGVRPVFYCAKLTAKYGEKVAIGKWIGTVISTDAVLLDQSIDYRPYHSKNADVKWEDSDLHQWLHSDEFESLIWGEQNPKETERSDNREFYIKTPVGKLHVYAKHEGDAPEDFPGVFVDLLMPGGHSELLSCTEYDSCDKKLQTCVYQLWEDEPTEIVEHTLPTVESILAEYKEARSVMSEDRERSLVADLFDVAELYGFESTFQTKDPNMEHHNGERFSVIDRMEEWSDQNRSGMPLSRLPAWRIRFSETHETAIAYPQEICKNY